MNPQHVRQLARMGMNAGIRTLAELHVAADVAARGECSIQSITHSLNLHPESAAHSCAVLQTGSLLSARNTKGDAMDILVAPTGNLKTFFKTLEATTPAPLLRRKHLAATKP